MDRCPVCETKLIAETLPSLTFFRCPSGHGTAMTVGLFRRLAGNKLVSAAWADAWSTAAPSPHSCPQCRNTMNNGAVPWDASEGGLGDSASSPLDLSLCQKCGIVWLDPQDAARLPGLQRKASEIRFAAEKAARTVQAHAEMAPLLREERKNDFGGQAPAERWKILPALLGMPVEYESPTFGPAWCTWTLAALTLFISIQAFNHPEVITSWGFIPKHAFAHGGLTALTTFFLHGGWVHLIGNMYALCLFGDDVEVRLGRLRYLGLLAGGTLAGAWLHGLLDPSSDVPLIGASGGIAAVIGAYALLFPHARLGIAIFLLSFIPKWINFPAWVALIGWGILQLVIATWQAAGNSEVSGFAHIGGVAVGLLVGRWAKRHLPTPPGS